VAHLSQGDKYKNIIWKLPQKTNVFGFLGADHLGTKIIINDETLELFSEFTYLDCSICYHFSNDVESKLEKLLQLIRTTKGTIFRKARTEAILKIYNTVVLPTFLYGSENWTVTASQRQRIEVAEMKLLDLWQATPFMTT